MQTDRLKVLALEGGPSERGRQHGETLRPQIHELLDRWTASLDRVYGISRERYVARFFAETKFEEALRHYAPTVLEEIRAIAQGADAPYPDLLAWQHINEEFWLALPRPGSGEACSTIARSAGSGRPSLIGQNLDLDQYLDGYQILLRSRCDASEGTILALSVPGMISLNGMNSHGFAVCDNALVQLRADIAGVPIFAIYRMLLESRSLDEAQALVRQLPHASGLNWVMGDPTRVAMIERSAGEMVLFGPQDADAIAYHTNHPLLNRDLAPRGAKPTRSTYLRLAALHERLARLDTDLAIDDIRRALASQDDPDYPVSRSGGRNQEDAQIGFTLACCIFELSGAPRLHIAAGPPHNHKFRTFTP